MISSVVDQFFCGGKQPLTVILKLLLFIFGKAGHDIPKPAVVETDKLRDLFKPDISK